MQQCWYEGIYSLVTTVVLDIDPEDSIMTEMEGKFIPCKGSRHGSDEHHVKVRRRDNTVSREPVNKEHGNDTARQMCKESPEPLKKKGWWYTR
jgi:hypothetical protein